MLVAKQLASLAGLAPGRVLPVFGLQPAQPAERALFPVPPGQRGAVFDEALTLLRLMLTSDEVTFQGSFFTVDGASAGPLPAKPLDIWLGGSAPAGLRRVGRLADGWLGSLLTPAEARGAVATINAAADEAGREVDQDHFGTSLAVAFGGIPDALAASIRRRRPDADPAALVADGWAGARDMISALIDAGLSKFVVRPATPPAVPRGLHRGIHPRADAAADLRTWKITVQVVSCTPAMSFCGLISQPAASRPIGGAGRAKDRRIRVVVPRRGGRGPG